MTWSDNSFAHDTTADTNWHVQNRNLTLQPGCSVSCGDTWQIWMWLKNLTCTLMNTLFPSDAIWRYRTRSTLVQVVAWCLMAPSHYLKQCWLNIKWGQWHLFKGNSTRIMSATSHKNYLENHLLQISFKSPRGHWVNGPWVNPYLWCLQTSGYWFLLILALCLLHILNKSPKSRSICEEIYCFFSQSGFHSCFKVFERFASP